MDANNPILSEEPRERMVRLSETATNGTYSTTVASLYESGAVKIIRKNDKSRAFIVSADEMSALVEQWKAYQTYQQEQAEAEQARIDYIQRVVEDATKRLQAVNMTYEKQYSRIIDRSMNYDRVLIHGIAIDDLSAIVDAIIANVELFRSITEVRDASASTFKTVWLNNSNS